jgi:Heterokaryon incompatibility protein (HET)
VDSTISTLRRWLGDCCSFHERCISNTSETALPKRVLDVGTLASPNLRLVQSSNEKTKYIALSYCWGLSGRVVTSMQNLEELLLHIEENRLPRTFRDAISITRKLGIRYLWIDALCIIQDCRLDWEEQSAKMGDVYGNAYLTLSASKASDVSEGFLGPRPLAAVPCGSFQIGGSLGWLCLSGNTEAHTMDANLSIEPLTSRGWTVQERLLSRRIVHFTSSQMIMQCRSQTWTEGGVEDNQVTDHLAAPLFIEEDEVYDYVSYAHTCWERILELYTRCKLSEPLDRLPALSGLASRFAKVLGDNYLAGHWQHTLPHTLMWQFSHRKDEQAVKRRPSWSWASVDAPVRQCEFAVPVCTEPLAEVLDCGSVTTGVDPFGAVSGGWLSLSAPAFPAKIQGEGSDNTLVTFIHEGDEYSLRPGENMRGRLHHEQSAGKTCLVVFLLKSNQRVEFYGLLVAPSESADGAYSRVGCFTELELQPEHCGILTSPKPIKLV